MSHATMKQNQVAVTQNFDCKSLLVQGMTPEEINDYTAKNGGPAQYQ